MDSVSTTPMQFPREADPSFAAALRAFVELIAQHWKLILAVTGLTMAATLLYLALAAPIFQTDALLQVETLDKSLTQTLSRQLQALTGNEAPVTGEVALVQSRTVLGKVFDSLNLDLEVIPNYFPIVGATMARQFQSTNAGLSAPMMGLSSYAWGGESLNIEGLKLPHQLVGQALTLLVGDNQSFTLLDPRGSQLVKGRIGDSIVAPTAYGEVQLRVSAMKARAGQSFSVISKGRVEAVDAFLKSFDAAEQGKDSGIIMISLRGQNPLLITEVVNRIAEEYQSQNSRLRSEQAGRTLEFLNQQLPILKQRVDEAEVALERYQRTQSSADMKTTIELALQQQVDLDANIQLLEQQREDLLQTYLYNHPTVKAVDAKLRQLTRTRDRNDKRVRALPASQREVLGLQRNVEVNTQLYTALLNETQQLQIAKATSAGNVRLVDRAVVPVDPIAPRPGLLMAAATILGLMLGGLAATAKSTLHTKLHDLALLERVADLAVMAEIPFSRWQARDRKNRSGPMPLGGGRIRSMSTDVLNTGHAIADHLGTALETAYAMEQKAWMPLIRSPRPAHILVRDEPEDPAANAIRALRSSVSMIEEHRPMTALALIGASHGVGNTFVAVNLATSVARSGQSVVLLNGNLKSSGLYSYGDGKAPGLMELLAESASLDEVLMQCPQGGFHFIDCGVSNADNTDLITVSRMQTLIGKLATVFDKVLIDAPAANASADAMTLGAAAGNSIVVFSDATHSEQQVRSTMRLFRRAGLNVVGAVFNKVRR